MFGVGPAEAVAGPGHDGNASVDSGAPRRRATSPFRSLLEDDVLPDGIGSRVYRPRGRRRSGIDMDAHPAELMTKARLHEGEGCWVKRLAG